MRHLLVTLLVEFADADTVQKAHYQPDIDNRSNYRGKVTVDSQVGLMDVPKKLTFSWLGMRLVYIKVLHSIIYEIQVKSIKTTKTMCSKNLSLLQYRLAASRFVGIHKQYYIYTDILKVITVCCHERYC